MKLGVRSHSRHSWVVPGGGVPDVQGIICEAAYSQPATPKTNKCVIVYCQRVVPQHDGWGETFHPRIRHEKHSAYPLSTAMSDGWGVTFHPRIRHEKHSVYPLSTAMS